MGHYWGRNLDHAWEPTPPRTGSLDDCMARGFDTDSAPTCRDCKTAIHDGDTCIECWRDRRALAVERDREWWSA